jgi:hypothetical protein
MVAIPSDFAPKYIEELLGDHDPGTLPEASFIKQQPFAQRHFRESILTLDAKRLRASAAYEGRSPNKAPSTQSDARSAPCRVAEYLRHTQALGS